MLTRVEHECFRRYLHLFYCWHYYRVLPYLPRPLLSSTQPLSPPPPSPSPHYCLCLWALHICIYVLWLFSSSTPNPHPVLCSEVRLAARDWRNWKVPGSWLNLPNWSQHVWSQTAEGSRGWCNRSSVGWSRVGKRNLRNLGSDSKCGVGWGRCPKGRSVLGITLH